MFCRSGISRVALGQFADQAVPPKARPKPRDFVVPEVWGEPGRHARSAIGAAELPFDMSVEVEAIFEVE